MTTPKITYAHLLTEPNPKHVESLIKFFESGCQQRGTGGFGVEIEHLPVHNSDDTAVTYYESNGIEALLNRIRPYYDENKEYWENGRLVGLARDGISVSLEPGGQLETSIGILHKPEELATLYGAFRREVDPHPRRTWFPTRQLWLPTEIQLRRHSRQSEGPIQGDDRLPGTCRTVRSVHDALLRFDTGQHRLRFEQDAIAKLRLGTVIGPILAWFFRNTPYFEGGENPYPLLRQRMWDYLDFQRTNVIPGLFDPRFGWEDYAVDVLSTPMMFADLTHTPEVLAVPGTDLHHPAFYENANDVYPDRELNAYEINHVISTHFNDVRLKNFIEFRHWDSLPVARAERLTEIIGSLFYDPTNLDRLESYFDGIREEDVFEAKANLQARGSQAIPYGNSLEFWQEFLGLEGVLADEPGDPKHPDVFQA